MTATFPNTYLGQPVESLPMVAVQSWSDYLRNQMLWTRRSWLYAREMHEALFRMRKQLDLPELDSEVVTPEQPASKRARWRKTEEQNFALLGQVADLSVSFAKDAIEQKRRVAWAPDVEGLGPDLVIESLPSDPFRIVQQVVTDEEGKPRRVVRLFDAQDKVVGQLGVGPVVVVAIKALTGVGIALLTYMTVSRVCDAFGSHLGEVFDRQLAERELKLIEAGKMTPEEATRSQKARAEAYVAAARAAAEFQKESGLGKGIRALETFLWVTLGLGIVGLGVYAIQTFGWGRRRVVVPATAESW